MRNYLHWLAQASRDDLRNQHFVGAGGTSVAPPTALLYLLLRHAYLTALERSTLLTGRHLRRGSSSTWSRAIR